MGEGSTTVAAPKAEVVEFVLDLERYRQADRKIGRVGEITRHGDTGTVRFSGRVRGLPGPSGVYPYEITATGMRFGSPTAGAAKWFLEFEGTFDFEEGADGTVVHHRETFEFKRPWRWVAEPFLRRWLERDTAEEMQRFKQILEG